MPNDPKPAQDDTKPATEPSVLSGDTKEPETAPEPKGDVQNPEGEKKADDGAKPEPEGDKATAATPPEKYELKLSESTPFTSDDLDLFAAKAKALGLTQEQAQAMVASDEQAVSETALRYYEQLTADTELGGQHLQASVDLARRGRDVLFPKDTPGRELISGWLERTGLGNHPELVRAFARLGKMVAEDGGMKAKSTPGAETINRPSSNEELALKLYPTEQK